MLFERTPCLFHLLFGQPRIQPQKSLPEVADEQNLRIAFTPEGAVFAQHFGIIGKRDLPAQFILQKMPRAFLNEDVFGVGVAHGNTLLLYLIDMIGKLQFID